MITDNVAAPNSLPVLRPALISVGALTATLGALIWSGRGYALGGPHMILGLIFVAGVVYVVASTRRSSRAARAFAAVAAVVVLALGVAQRLLVLPEPHWVVQIAHAATGIVAMVATGRLLASRSTL
jgi:hypothetical protein